MHRFTNPLTQSTKKPLLSVYYAPSTSLGPGDVQNRMSKVWGVRSQFQPGRGSFWLGWRQFGVLEGSSPPLPALPGRILFQNSSHCPLPLVFLTVKEEQQCAFQRMIPFGPSTWFPTLVSFLSGLSQCPGKTCEDSVAVSYSRFLVCCFCAQKQIQFKQIMLSSGSCAGVRGE